MTPDVVIGEPQGDAVGMRLNASTDACVVATTGYFQDPRYFHHRRHHVASALWNPVFAEQVAKKLAQWLPTGAQLTVAVHIRRGDFAGSHMWLGEAYFKAALERVWKSVPTSAAEDWTCLFFSDDTDYLKDLAVQLCPGRHVIVNEPAEDVAFYLLAMCCVALVISNSSFSWWAAYLAGARQWGPPAGLVVAPRISGRRKEACRWSEAECTARASECVTEWLVLSKFIPPGWLVLGIDDFVPPRCPVQASLLQDGDPACWKGGFSWELCCDPGVWGVVGNEACFPGSSPFTHARCCRTRALTSEEQDDAAPERAEAAG
eukprot:gnl/TRDRNA2_/TRDRNA2_94679_c1_seq1.p1 gnl/TRDRNA2_/TRDRNA2_94679_c1~~gnl/TRDRNA2_/TRDRNA2_94679_c1_seq1.p1  ORF type:complete len:318 (+),score=58.29 gnl/TRDRNA2_/TRDRNA2_94679_c1_seq1:66-1019(+)